MTPNIPGNALAIFGPDPSPTGQWGGVPWMHGVLHPETLEGMANRSVTTFPYAAASAVLAVTDSDNDLDGPGGGTRVDPDYESGTALRCPGGTGCDSRRFPGVVISPVLKALGVRLGDFCLVSWNGAIRSAQVYDIGPTRKAGENSIYLNRGLGLIPAGKSDHWAALNGHDAQDVVTLFFAGSGPSHALPVDEIIDRTHALWAQFTGRLATAPVAGAQGTPAGKPGGGAASGSVGLAAPLCLALMAVFPLLAQEPLSLNNDTITFIGGAVGVAAIVKLGTGIWADYKKATEKPVPMPPNPQPFMVATVKEYALAADLTALEADVEKRHTQNQARFDSIDDKLDRNFAAHAEASGKELKAMHERLSRVAESNAQLVGEMKHVVASAEKASSAAVIAAEAARGAIQAAAEARRAGGHFSGGQG